MTKKRWLCYDIETVNFIKSGRDLSDLQLSMLGWYRSWDKSIHIIQQEDLYKFFNDVQKSHLIVGFNTKGFDNIIMKQYDNEGLLDLIPHFDMMEEIVRVRGHRVSLDSIAKASLDRKKTEHSSIAPILWREGRFEELRQYLKTDVELTRDIFIKGCTQKELLFQSKVSPYEVLPIDTTHWFEKAKILLELGMGGDKYDK